MNRQEAARILGIGVDDDMAQVKKAYRKLAMCYHPDRNSSEDAKAKFIEALEAYSYLDDIASGKINESQSKQKDRSQYGPDWRRDAKTNAQRTYSKEEFEKRYREAHRMADEIFEQKSNAIYANALKEYQNSWRKVFVKYFAPFAAILALLLMVDYFLPTSPLVRTDTFVYQDKNGWGSSFFLQYGNRHCPISKDAYLILSDNESIATIHQKPILRHATQIDLVTQQGKIVKIQPYMSVHSLFPMLNLLLMLPFFSLFVEKARFWFVFFLTYANLYLVPSLFLIIIYRMLA